MHILKIKKIIIKFSIIIFVLKWGLGIVD